MKVIGTSKVVINSRVSIPPEAREVLGIEIGDVVQWVQVGPLVVLEKAEPSKDAINYVDSCGKMVRDQLDKREENPDNFNIVSAPRRGF